MKALMLTAALAATLTAAQAFAESAQELEAKAAAAYAKRDYSNAGANSAQEAADLYAKAAAASQGDAKAKYLAEQSAALYFVGDANTVKDVKIDKFLKGIGAADQSLKVLGIADVTTVTDAQLAQLKSSLKKEQLAILGGALYQRGANLGQWGQQNGVMQSLGKWPELRRTMEVIVNLGLLASTHNYGAYRILGRGYFKIPSLMGGDMVKATNYLKTAFNSTLVTLPNGKKVSKNGYNNTYYAEVLNENGDTAGAKAILQNLIAADPAQVDAASVPEIKNAQREAKELLKGF